MDLDEQGKAERRKVTEDFLRFAEKAQEESDTRRAVSGESAQTILVGVDPEQGTIVVIDVDEETASQPFKGST